MGAATMAGANSKAAMPPLPFAAVTGLLAALAALVAALAASTTVRRDIT